MTDIIPAGAVIAWAASDTSRLDGWLLCDGSQLSIKTYPDLYGAIGTANGGDGNTVFYLPNYQGIFLRGMDDGAGNDPDAADRVAPQTGGATGDNVGSYQAYATANAHTAFKVSIPNLPSGTHKFYPSSGGDSFSKPNSSATSVTIAGGYAESRPVNIYVNFLIKSDNITAGLPIGGIVPFSGAVAGGFETCWILCDGRALTCDDYAALFEEISTNNGGQPNSFNLPDLRGRFIRGVANGNARDPDAGTDRIAAQPGGVTGDAVGSLQPWNTGLPGTNFTISPSHLPNSDESVDISDGHGMSYWNSGSVTRPVSSGGDKETRPVNLYVDFYINYQAPASGMNTLPIGAMIAFAGSQAPPSSEWLYCNGSSNYPQGQYADLFAVLGTVNGGDGANDFMVPDCRGRFLRGVDHGAGVDPDTATRTAAAPGGSVCDAIGSVQTWATGMPTTSFTATLNHLPTVEHHTADALGSSSGAAWNGGSTSATVTGGDNETRPANAYVRWYVLCGLY